MAKNILALEIGNKNLKAVMLQQNRTGTKVIDYLVLPMNDHLYDHEGILIVDEVKPFLQGAISKLKAQKTPVALTINSSKKIVRTRELPMTSLHELEGIVRFEAEQFLPYSINEFYIDFRVIGAATTPIDQQQLENGAVSGVKVMIGALPKEILDAQMELINSCGLKITSITLHTDALFSYAKAYLLEKGKAVIVCDIGASSTNTVLFENHEFMADIASEYGIGRIVNAFSLKNGLDYEQSMACFLGAEDLQLTKHDSEMDQLYKKIEKLNQYMSVEMSDLEKELMLGGKDNSQATTARESILENSSELYSDILKEVSRMMEFYRTRHFGTPVESIYLCGGGAAMYGLVDFLKERLDTESIFLISSLDTSPIMHEDINLLAAVLGGAIGR